MDINKQFIENAGITNKHMKRYPLTNIQRHSNKNEILLYIIRAQNQKSDHTKCW